MSVSGICITDEFMNSKSPMTPLLWVWPFVLILSPVILVLKNVFYDRNLHYYSWNNNTTYNLRTKQFPSASFMIPAPKYASLKTFSIVAVLFFLALLKERDFLAFFFWITASFLTLPSAPARTGDEEERALTCHSALGKVCGVLYFLAELGVEPWTSWPKSRSFPTELRPCWLNRSIKTTTAVCVCSYESNNCVCVCV